MRKSFFLILILFGSFFSIFSQETISVWEKDKAPTQNGLDDEAQLVVYLPQTNSSDNSENTPTPAVLICPGGGYAGLSMQYEGHGFAQWMASHGIAGIILKYRLPNKHKEIPFDDAEKAMQIIRANAHKWNIDVDKIGIAGFSAGGHLAAVFSNLENVIRPSFTILFYPVISFD